MFHKILIANRGEIALRIIRTCRELGIRSVVAHSKADTDSLPVRLADESICVGPDVARLSYLNIPAIISAAAVGSKEIYCEKFVERARHVEVQVLGDKNGIRVHLGERECSVQRRHQKLLEESPAPNLGAETRAGLYRAALTVAAAVNYVSAGTVEFIVDAEGHHYFIEMNTRIQVEHPVTEMVTGTDLVREQTRIADGEGLGYRQDAVRFEGHAIECRINAEDPATVAPSAGRITAWVPPGGFNVRVDSHLMAPYSVPPFYDSLLAKIIVRGADRAEAIGRMRRALAETVVEGVKTSIPFHLKVLNDPAFLEGRFTSVDTERLRA